jgi:TPR repeat protein
MPNFFSIQTYLYLWGYRDDISLGKCFHYGIHTQKDLKVARTYYLQAIKNKKYAAFHQLSLLSRDEGRIGESFYYSGLHYEQTKDWQQALAAYEKAANENYALAMYRAGKLFARDRFSKRHQVVIKQDMVTELGWYRKATVNYSAHALDALLKLSAKEAKASLHLAQMYEQGEIGNKKVMSAAFSYYEKAHEMQEQEATCRLGRFYELGEAPVSKNLQKAFYYYAIVTKEPNKLALEALAALERIVKILENNNLLSFQLAVIYQDDFSQSLSAFKCYQLMANKGDNVAWLQMQKLANENTDCAYELAKIYEKDSQAESHLQTAYLYFARAMRGHHRAAKDHLESLAHSGHVAAQYILAETYYQQQFFDKAIDWCLKAVEQHDEPALYFLKNAPFTNKYYIYIAESYEQGKEDIAKNNPLALYFYEKAMVEKDKEAAFRLGQWYQYDNEGKAFDYWVKAVQWGHSEALPLLERLAAELEPNRQLQLANLYRDPPFNNHYKALYWGRQAIVANENSSLSDETLIKLIENTEKNISFENLNLFSQKMTHVPVLTTSSLFSLLKYKS